jgi:hypothetical protein
MKYSCVKYYLMRWYIIQDGWIKVEVLSIVIEWSLVDNLVTSENKRNFAEISKKKKSHNLRHTISYLTLVKKCLRFHDIWRCYKVNCLCNFFRIICPCMIICIFPMLSFCINLFSSSALPVTVSSALITYPLPQPPPQPCIDIEELE